MQIELTVYEDVDAEIKQSWAMRDWKPVIVALVACSQEILMVRIKTGQKGGMWAFPQTKPGESTTFSESLTHIVMQKLFIPKGNFLLEQGGYVGSYRTQLTKAVPGEGCFSSGMEYHVVHVPVTSKEVGTAAKKYTGRTAWVSSAGNLRNIFEITGSKKMAKRVEGVVLAARRAGIWR